MCLSGPAIVHSAAAHKVLTLSPAIWHCLTKDTNIPNWIQPLRELFQPILRKDDMMFSECCAPTSLSWICAHLFSVGWNRFEFLWFTFYLNAPEEASMCCVMLVWKRIAFPALQKTAAVVQNGITSVLASLLSIARERFVVFFCFFFIAAVINRGCD